MSSGIVLSMKRGKRCEIHLEGTLRANTHFGSIPPRIRRRNLASRAAAAGKPFRLHRKPDSASLAEIVRMAQRGDAAAFETIYLMHWRRVYALCLRMLRDPMEAEDLAQEAFLQLFRKIRTFRGDSAFSSWLHRLTANLVLMSFRRKKPATTSLDDVVKPDTEYEVPHLEIGVPDLRLSGLYDRMNIESAVEELPEGYRLMFMLHDVHGYEHNEIAEILNCSIGNSKSQLHKARKRMRVLLARMSRQRRFAA